jgi:hypothetical protein
MRFPLAATPPAESAGFIADNFERGAIPMYVSMCLVRLSVGSTMSNIGVPSERHQYTDWPQLIVPVA